MSRRYAWAIPIAIAALDTVGITAGVASQAFGSRLREQVDLDFLTTDLRSVVIDTMQPAHVSLWVPTPRGHR